MWMKDILLVVITNLKLKLNCVVRSFMSQAKRSNARKHRRNHNNDLESLVTEINQRSAVFQQVHQKLNNNKNVDCNVDTLLHLASLIRLTKLTRKLKMDYEVHNI